MKTLVLIPAFNEENNIAQVIREIKSFFPRVSIMVVNDGSTDKTEIVAEKEGVLVFSHPFNLGYGAALQTGFKYALDKGFDFIIQMDGDGQHDPKFIKDLLKPLINNKTDLVIGSRFLRYSYKMPLLKKIGVYLFRFLIKIITNQTITDPTSGFRAFKKKLLDFFVSEAYPTDFPDADLLITLIRGGIKVKETPVRMYPSPKNKKPMHQGVISFYYVFKVFLSILIGLLRR